MEESYRLLRRMTGLSSRPLLSRQAVQILGRDQNFSNQEARELLGWEPRVDYETGLEATIDWLRHEYLR
jgi:nucleoside-diphosphate-sugar epimerase